MIQESRKGKIRHLIIIITIVLLVREKSLKVNLIVNRLHELGHLDREKEIIGEGTPNFYANICEWRRAVPAW